MRPSIIFQIGMKILTPVLLVGSVIIFWRGHQLPGGGFIGGLVAGATFATHAFCYGVDSTLRLIRLHPLSFVFIGLFLALISGVISLLVGAQVFQGQWVTVPVIGMLGTPQIFDLGVYLLVAGLVAVFISEILKEDT
ncbi:MnhB domain-containing protein [Pseudobdellovibrio exovorus]|uniref:Na+/H+ antiporter MnhB subunit-related protein domain-containing protein n=1 Tax=Pseudobdellovibrio exovorus JSS TaxID=1184267 RepID=M4V4X2_9BACT|nr:MnhB domain-containing protein [Pseudobdellovibrio exovorus]AGH94387.1 hypothetical protein A11Q_167 [Pseudobdellovibrio exovorus JSS]